MCLFSTIDYCIYVLQKSRLVTGFVASMFTLIKRKAYSTAQCTVVRDCNKYYEARMVGEFDYDTL